ncbi:hypothetical protein RYX36_013379 [Vicia faba]
MNSVAAMQTTKYIPPHMRNLNLVSKPPLSNRISHHKQIQTTKYLPPHMRFLKPYSKPSPSSNNHSHHQPIQTKIQLHLKLETNKFYAGASIFMDPPSPRSVPLPISLIKKL